MIDHTPHTVAWLLILAVVGSALLIPAATARSAPHGHDGLRLALKRAEGRSARASLEHR